MLQAQCKAWGLGSGGTTAEMLRRYKAYVKSLQRAASRSGVRLDPLTADPTQLCLDDLKAQLKTWACPSSGIKGDLIKRYRAFVKTGAPPAPKKRKTKEDCVYQTSRNAWITRMYQSM